MSRHRLSAGEQSQTKKQRSDDGEAAGHEGSHVVTAAPATLFKDALHLVLTFLSDGEWKKQQPWQVCRHWLAVNRSMPSRRMSTHVWKPKDVQRIAASPTVRRHVTHLTARLDWDARGQPLVDAICASLGDSLTGLSFQGLPWYDVAHYTISDDGRWIPYVEPVYPDIDLAPLLQLRRLETISVADTLSDRQVEVIKRMTTSFRSIYFYSNEKQLIALCTPPHRLQRLESLSLQSETLTELLMQLLIQLPSLTRLDPYGMHPECLPLLSQVKHLRHLVLSIISSGVEGSTGQQNSERFKFSVLAPHLGALGQLRVLVLGWRFDHDTEVIQLMTAMPHLETLTLNAVTMPSLTGLAAATSLTSLRLTRCREVTFKHLYQLAACPRLSDLNLEAGAILSEVQIDELTVPSKRLPALNHFSYRWR